ncbi:glutamate synthase-related protein, partial [Staphylococcus aureus]|uniref:glutamate synthase-related protein n=1 Tax=Staphylococcus aureus TaxID=1280 RepID=UPI0021094D0B
DLIGSTSVRLTEGKYVSLQDAYLSVVESLKHAGYPFAKDIDIRWIDSSEVTDENSAEYLADVDGILVPGGFGFRASEGKISEGLFKEVAQLSNVRAFELKLAQGAKTRGGHMEDEKVNEEIAKIRNVEPYKTINSPNRY